MKYWNLTGVKYLTNSTSGSKIVTILISNLLSGYHSNYMDLAIYVSGTLDLLQFSHNTLDICSQTIFRSLQSQNFGINVPFCYSTLFSKKKYFCPGQTGQFIHHVLNNWLMTLPAHRFSTLTIGDLQLAIFDLFRFGTQTFMKVFGNFRTSV